MSDEEKKMVNGYPGGVDGDGYSALCDGGSGK